MRPLDEALEQLAEQDPAIPVEALVERLELKLRGGTQPVLVDDTYSPPRRSRPPLRRPLLMFGVGALVAAAVALPILFLGRTESPTTTLAPATTVPTPTTLRVVTTVPSTTTSATTPTTTTLPPLGDRAVTIVRDVIDSADTSPGDFTASGPAVEDGLVCAAGTTFENRFEDRGGGSEAWEARFVCNDGSGSFSIQVESRGAWVGDPGTEWAFTTTWVVITEMGSGNYTHLAGAGTGEGMCLLPEDRCVEAVDGVVRRD